MKDDERYATAMRLFEAGWQEHLASAQTQKKIVAGADTIYEIPLVLHVVHNGEAIGTPNNPSDTQLVSLIKYVNATFEASWPGYATPATGGVHTRIRIVLAAVNGNCQSTNGIVRVNGSSVPGYKTNGVTYSGGTGLGAPDILVRRLSYWNMNEYMNVWLVHKIDNSGVAGYAALPSGAVPDSNSRIVILTQYAMSGSSTLTHELGHALGLKHTFEGDNGGTTCPPTTSCTTTGDMVCDTEPDKSWPNCSATTNPCTGTAYKGVQFNYMNYSSCRDRFTAGQRDRMQYFLSTTWNSLRYSRTGDPKATVAMVPAKCTNGEVTPGVGVLGPTLVSFKDIYHASGIKYEEGRKAYVDNTCSYRTSVSPGMTYPLTIGIQGNVQDIRVYLDYNNDGTFQVPSEEIYSVRSSVATGTQSTNITIPTSGVVRNKPLRLRVITDYPQTSGLGPCVALGSGQAEDYAVTVSDNLAVSQPWEASQPLVYPNPANDAVNISFPGSFTGTVSMYNAVGQIVSSMSVHNKTTCLVKTDTYPAGCYTLHLKEDNGVFTTMKINVYH